MQLNFKSFGSGQPFVILHGLFGMLDNWQSIAKDLSTDYLMYIMDHRNHGRSDHDSQMDYASMSADVRETMESQWLYDGAIIMGHSMGGKTAMQLALQDADLVKQLIIVDIAPISYSGGHEQIIEALQSVPIREANSRNVVQEHLSQMIPKTEIVSFLMKNLSRTKSGGYEWKMNLEAIANNYEVLMGFDTSDCIPYQGPTLFIKGGLSDYITDESLDTIQHWFPNNQIISVDGAGHWVHAERPVEIKNIIRSFLEQPI